MYLYLFLLSLTGASCQDIRWRWVTGSGNGNQAMTSSFPGSRSGSGVWQDRRKYAWIFGGQVYNPATKKVELKNDLWRLDLQRFTWERIHPGSENPDISKNNTNRAPMPRQLPSTCGVPDKMIVIYGGANKDGSPLGDTWVFYIPESKWLPLSEMVKKFKNETIGESPPERASAATWCLQRGLFVFSGADDKDKLLKDMWMFDMIDLKWSETKASAQLNDNQLTASLVTMPAGRTGAATWVGFNNALYIFSGNQRNGNSRSKHSNKGFGTDLWEYNITTGHWRFLMGHQNKCVNGVYGKMGHPNKDNIPGCRIGAAAWTDTMGNIWLFGGDGASSDPQSISDTLPSKTLSDLWLYDLDRKVWYWMGGSKKGDDPGKYRDMDNTYTTGIFPSSRRDAVSWKMWNEFYIWGGTGHDSTKAYGVLTDMWGIDAHTKVVYNYTAYPGTIFMIVFSLSCLVLIVVVTYMYVRKHFRNNQERSTLKDVEYSRLSTDVD